MDDRSLSRLGATPTQAAQLVVDVPDAALDLSRAGAWAPRTVLAYLRDAESLVWRLRLQRLLAEDGPELAPFDTGRWFARLGAVRARRAELLADFALQRQATLSLLRSLRPDDLARTGSLDGEGRLTVAALIGRWLDHDAEQIGRLEQALGTTVAEAVARRFHPPE